MRARFWIRVNCGWVKLTLAPGQTLRWRKFAPDAEGWGEELEKWTHEGNQIRRESGFRGRDCDGPVSCGEDAICHLSRLIACPPFDDGSDRFRPPGRPDWQAVEQWQHDDAAELAGY